MKITAIIVVNGNPPHLSKSLTSIINHVDEIIIGDIGMTAILPNGVKAKSKIIKLDPTIPYADLVKESLKKEARGEYVLYLDPDEIITEQCWNVIKKEMDNYDYFLIPRKNIMFGKWISHARWWPDYQLRFFKKDTVVWPKEIHPTPTPSGVEYKFEASEELAIVHYNYDSISHYLEKAQRYAKSEALQKKEKKEEITLSDTLSKSTSEFISRYFAGEGYKDGMHGFVLAFFQMFYYFLVYFYFWELSGYKAEPNSNNETKIADYFKQLSFESNYWLIKKNLVSPFKKLQLKLKNNILKF